MSDPTPAGREGLVLVGKVIKPHGIRGEFCVQSYADSPAIFQGLNEVMLASGRARPLSHPLRSVREHKGRLLLTLKNVSDRSKAEALRGYELFVPEDALPELDDDEFYLRDLLGMEITQEDGLSLGTFEEIIETPGQIVWVIRHESGKEVLLPAVEGVVVDVNYDDDQIIVAPPQGLVELYLNPPKAKAKPKTRTNKKRRRKPKKFVESE